MKKNLQMVIMLMIGICITGGLRACKDKNSPESEAHVVVMKFKKAEYKNYILANYLEGTDSIVATRFNRCEKAVGQTESSPYWELPNDWLLVDWKWFNFPYNAGLTVLTGKTWNQCDHLLQRWPLTEPHEFQPVEEILYIRAEALAKYSNTSYNADLLSLMNGNLDEDGTNICDMSNRADSLWAIVYRHLSIAIEKGDLQELK